MSSEIVPFVEDGSCDTPSADHPHDDTVKVIEDMTSEIYSGESLPATDAEEMIGEIHGTADPSSIEISEIDSNETLPANENPWIELQEMMREMYSVYATSETPSAADSGEYSRTSVGEYDSRWTSYEVTMLNCYKHRQHLFNRCKDGMLHRDVLISFWMMCGYLSPFDSVDEAYKKGNHLLRDLIQGGLLKLSDEDMEMIELVGSTCSHGLSPCCDATSVGFTEMLPVDRIEEVFLTDGMTKKRNSSPHGNYLCRQVFQSKRGLKYIAHFNPTPNSLTPLLVNVNNPSVLMFRGFDDHLFPMTAFTSKKLETLTALEISGSGILNAAPLYLTISKLTKLKYLNLSDPLIDSLPDNLFSNLVELRLLILRGCSRLDFNQTLAHLRNLEVLDLSYTSTTLIPITDTGILTHLYVRDSSLTSRETLLHHGQYKNLKFLDLSENRNFDFYDFNYVYKVSPLIALDLSRTSIPDTDLLFHWSPLIRNLILRECTKLENLSWELKNTPTDLEVLDLSGCENLIELTRDVFNLKNMKELNLARCRRLKHLREGLFDRMTSLLKLDLSATKIKRLPSFANLTSLRKLTLRGLELDSLEAETWTSLSNLVKLDLHGLKISTSEELNLDFLTSLLNLQTLNLSSTSVAKLPDISMLVSLKEFLLAGCWNLKVVPDLQSLTSLQTFDVSLPDDPTRSCQLQVEPEAQRVLPLSVRTLVLTNRPGVQRLFPLSSPGNLEFLDICVTDEIDFIRVPWSNKSENLQGQRTFSKAVEFHIVYDVEHTGFDRFIYEFERIDLLFSEIQKTANTKNNQANYFERQFEMLHTDMKYLRENIDRLKSSRDWKSGDKLLHELVDAVTKNHLSAADFKYDSPNLKQLLRLLVRLKLLLPPTQMNEQEDSKITQKNKKLFIKSEQIVSEPDEHHPQESSLHLNYKPLTRIQKNCLFCFAAFPCNEQVEESNAVQKKNLVIKKRTLINWWVSEGFLEKESFQDNGKQMLKDLVEKGFVEPVMKERRKSASFRMNHHVHSFVTAQAKSESFFDFYKENSWLRQYFTRSNMGSLPKTKAKFPACNKLWANSKNCPRELENMRNVVTLFNTNGSVLDIKPERFSKMEQLSVLSLGSWGCSETARDIEIVDQKFLEELKMMKQLRLISLQGLTPIIKLPESICQLSNLMILDLRECGYLEELPAGIGSLRNLIHLDLTDCVILQKMPKGISLLSNLEVLRGFKITQSQSEKTTKRCMSVMIHGKDSEVCTLEDLSNLERLNKLSLVVKIEEFPNKGDLEILMGMKCLRKLKILWEMSYYSDNTGGSSSQQHYHASLPNHWDLEKLELWCFPYKTLPRWMFSMKLEKLYIMGGDLAKFNVLALHYLKTLRLKYLRKIRLTCPIDLDVKSHSLTYMEIKECSFCSNSIWWNDGDCIWDLPEDSYPGVFFRPRD